MNRLAKAVIRTPKRADGHVDWDAVPVGATVFVTVTDADSSLRGRVVPLTKRPDGQMAIDIGGARAAGYNYGAWADKIGQGKRSVLSFAHRAIDVGKMRESVKDAEKREVRAAAIAKNEPIKAEIREQRKAAREAIRVARNEFLSAVGIDKVTMTAAEAQGVRNAALDYALSAGMSRENAEAYAAAVTRLIRKRDEQYRQGTAVRRKAADEVIAKKPAGDDKLVFTREEQQVIDAAMNQAPQVQIQLPEAPVDAKTPQEVEHAVAKHFAEAETQPVENPAAGLVTPSDAVSPPSVKPERQAISAEEATKRIESMNDPVIPDEKIIEMRDAESPKKRKAPIVEDIGKPLPPPVVTLGGEIPKFETTSPEQAALAVEKYHQFHASRLKAKELRGELVEVPPADVSSSAGVRELRMEMTPATEKQIQMMEQHYEESLRTHGRQSFYEALGEHWNDNIGYTLNGYVAEGAASALTGLVGKHFGRRFDVGRLTDALSPEAAAMVLADLVKRKTTAKGFDDFVGAVAGDNAKNLMEQEERAMAKHAELKRQWNEIVRQKGDGSLASEATIAMLEADNLREQRENLGTAFGSLSASAALLAALEQRQRHDDDSKLTINVGSTRDGAVERLRMLHLDPAKATLLYDQAANGWLLHTTVRELDRFVSRTVVRMEERKEMAAIKNDTSDTAGYRPHGFKETFEDPFTGETKPLKLRTNQRNDVEWLRRQGGGVITRVTGAGKTLTMLGYQGELLKDDPGSRHINIVPPGQVKQWVAEARNFTLLPVVEVPEGSDKETRAALYGKLSGKPAIFITSHRDASFDVDSIEKLGLASMAIDEPQNLRSRTSSKGSAAVKRITKIDVPHRVALTATPARESAVEAYDAVTWAAKRPIGRDQRGRTIYDKPLGSRVGFERAFSGFGGGTNAQDEALQRFVSKELEEFVSGDLVKTRDYKVNKRDVPVKRTAAQIERQKAIEADVPQIIEEERQAVPAAERRGNWQKKAHERALKRVLERHRENLHGGDDNAKVNTLLSEAKADIAAGKSKHVIFVDSDVQRRAVYHGLVKAGYKQNQVANITRSATKLEVEKRKAAWKGHQGASFMIIDRSSQSGHNLNEGQVYHILGNPDDAAGMVQGIGRLDRSPRSGDVDVRKYRHEDSPFEDVHWNKIDSEMKILGATAPGLAKSMQNEECRMKNPAARCVVRCTGRAAVALLEKAEKQLAMFPGMVLGPSKKDPTVKRWQQTQTAAVGGASGKPKLEVSRASYPSGYLVPQAGDRVFQAARGPFGTPAYIYGHVALNRKGEPRVQIAGSASVLGAGVNKQRTYPIGPEWRVEGDPEIKRREAARDAKKRAEEEQRRAEEEGNKKASDEARARALRSGQVPLTKENMRIGATARFYGNGVAGHVMVITEIHDGEPYGVEPDAVGKETGGYFGKMDDWLLDPSIPLVDVAAKTKESWERSYRDGGEISLADLLEKYPDLESKYGKERDTETCDLFVREATKEEKRGGVARHRGFNTFPDKSGYEKAYKPYGESGAGYYYAPIPGDQAKTDERVGRSDAG